ncbi:unnamed protein product, partial [Candidula unifasciata]
FLTSQLVDAVKCLPPLECRSFSGLVRGRFQSGTPPEAPFEALLQAFWGGGREGREERGEGTSRHNGRIQETSKHNGRIQETSRHNGKVKRTFKHNKKVKGMSEHNERIQETSRHNGKV